MPILAIFRVIGDGAISLLSSQIGRLLLVAVVAFGFGHHRASVVYERQIAAQHAEIEAAHAREVAREREAAQEIARASDDRAQADALAQNMMRAKIDAFAQAEKDRANEKPKVIRIPGSPVPTGDCALDDAFARSVRDIDSGQDRTPKPSRRARHVR